jgi:hypothetical protein
MVDWRSDPGTPKGPGETDLRPFIKRQIQRYEMDATQVDAAAEDRWSPW